jgi:hypothetical protein
MTPEAQRLADECKRLAVAALNAAESTMPPFVGVTPGQQAMCAVLDAIDKLASMIPAGGLQDAIRLDALERNEWECLLSGEPGAMQWYIVSYDTHVLDGLKVGKFGKTPREAIDSALSAKEQPR